MPTYMIDVKKKKIEIRELINVQLMQQWWNSVELVYRWYWMDLLDSVLNFINLIDSKNSCICLTELIFLTNYINSKNYIHTKLHTS